jgi:hypothetical protein
MPGAGLLLCTCNGRCAYSVQASSSFGFSHHIMITVQIAHNAPLQCCTGLQFAVEAHQSTVVATTPKRASTPSAHYVYFKSLWNTAAASESVLHIIHRITAAACTLFAATLVLQAARGRQPPITESATRCDVAALDVFAGENTCVVSQPQQQVVATHSSSAVTKLNPLPDQLFQAHQKKQHAGRFWMCCWLTVSTACVSGLLLQTRGPSSVKRAQAAT